MTNQEQITRISEYAKLLNQSATDKGLLDFVVLEVLDRVLLYLNEDELEERLERIVARIVSGVFTKSAENQNGQIARDISSISDNGQTISYSSQIKNYLTSVEDSELFGGAAKLLAPYRRVDVATK